MSQVISIADDLYEKVAALARAHGQPVESFVEDCLMAAVEDMRPAEEEAAKEYDPASDPLAPFIGAFEVENDPGWIERHDQYFGGAGAPHAKE